MSLRVQTAASTIATVLAIVVAPVGAQHPHCAALCAPTIVLMPAMLRTHLFGGPRVQDIASSRIERLPSSTNLEIILAASATTAIPRTSAFYSVQWLPNAPEQRNPFTLYTASQLGGSLRANAPTMTLGASISALTASQTRGIVDLDGVVADLFSQAARPGDKSSFTHKLDLELATHWHPFNALSQHDYLHRVTLLGLLDYVATGLPRAGDEVPKGRLFLDNARPTSLIIALAFPLTPEPK